MTWIKESANGSRSFNFVAPEGATNATNEVLFPFHEKQTPAYAATLAVAVKQYNTVLAPGKLTGNATINLSVNSQVTPGAKLLLRLEADSTQRTVTLGTGFDADADQVVVPISSVVFLEFTYDGTAFMPVAINSVELAELTSELEVLKDTEVLDPDYAATLAVSVAKRETFLQPKELTGGVTLNLTIDVGLAPGSKLHIKLTADSGANRTVTLGVGFDAAAAAITVTKSTTSFKSFVYDGTAFVPLT